MAKAPGASAPPLQSPSLWLGLGLAASVGFAVAVFRLVFISAPIGIAVAAALGALAYYALDTFWQLRQAELRRGPKLRPVFGGGVAREVSLAPSFDIYDPRRAESAEAEVPPRQGE